MKNNEWTYERMSERETKTKRKKVSDQLQLYADANVLIYSYK